MLFNGLCVSAVCRPVTRKLANRGKRKIAYHPREAAVRRSSKLNGIGIAAAVAAVKMGADIEGAGVMASREDTSENLWARLYELAPIRSAKPASTLEAIRLLARTEGKTALNQSTNPSPERK